MSIASPASLSEDYPLVVLIRVRTYELDSFGHVNNAVYLQYMEEARSEYLKQMGLSFADFDRFGVQIVIAESYLRHLLPLRYGDTIAVEGRIRDVRPASSIFDYRLRRVATAELAAEAWTRAVFVRASNGRPTRAPREFAEAFQKIGGGRANADDVE